MPCPHFDVKIIQRSKRQSAVASAAYQSGERLFSKYDQKQKYYSHKSEIVHTEIMLPPHAPPEYADRNTLWNAAEAIEKQWNSQLARRLVLAIPNIRIDGEYFSFSVVNILLYLFKCAFHCSNIYRFLDKTCKINLWNKYLTFLPSIVYKIQRYPYETCL